MQKISRTIGTCRFIYNFYLAHNKEILKKYDLPLYDAFELLSRSGGRLPIDTYKFVDFKYSNSPYANE